MSSESTQERRGGSVLARAARLALPVCLVWFGSGIILFAPVAAAAAPGVRAALWLLLGGLAGAWILRSESTRRAAYRRLAASAESPDRAGAAGLAVPPTDPARPLTEAFEEILRKLVVQEALVARLRGEQDAVLRSMDSGVLILDHQQHITSLNRAAEGMLGLHAGAARGRLLHEVSREPELHRFVGAAFSASGPEAAEILLGGEAPRRVRAAASVLPGPERRSAGLLVVLSDVTQLRRLEAVRSDFAANVSHELRTPITNIKGYVETLIETRLSDPEESMRFLRIVSRNAERLGAIVEDMLMLTQLERPEARDQLVREPALIAEVLDAMQLEQEAEAKAKEIRVECRVDPGLEAMVNPQLLQQAVGNLVNNAIKYGQRGSRVEVRAAGRRALDGRRELLIEVRDQGPGISAEHLPRVFERFYRVDKARGREQGGTGLGLAIVKHIAQLHAGSVEVESEVGRGSTFRLVLPA